MSSLTTPPREREGVSTVTRAVRGELHREEGAVEGGLCAPHVLKQPSEHPALLPSPVHHHHRPHPPSQQLPQAHARPAPPCHSPHHQHSGASVKTTAAALARRHYRRG